MKQQPFLDRLDGLGFVTRGGALEWAGLVNAPGRLPALYVVPGRETAGASRLDHGLDQRVEAEIEIVLVLNAATRSADQVSEQLDELARAVIERLAGWVHPDACAPTVYIGGGLAGIEKGTLVWTLGVRTAFHLRKTSHG